MKALKSLVRVIDLISSKVGHVASYTMLILIVTTSIEIVFRYFLNKPTIWAYELGQMIFGSYFLLAGAMTLRERGHIGMDLIINKMSQRRQALMNSVTFIFALLFCCVFIWKGWEFAVASLKRLENSTSVWGPPIYPYKLMLPLSGLLLLAQGISNFIKDFYLALTGNHLSTEED
jgi:TRAP-type mannitol/chloroaromatic compound transport system permease small subunit